MRKLIHKFLNKETISYLVFGVLTTLVNYVVFFGLNYLFDSHDTKDPQYLVANFIAWVIAVLFAFFTNKLFVFESKSFQKKLLIKEFISFTGTRVLTLVFESAFLLFTVELLAMSESISKILCSFFVIILNYIASKFFTFKSSHKESTITNEE